MIRLKFGAPHAYLCVLIERNLIVCAFLHEVHPSLKFPKVVH